MNRLKLSSWIGLSLAASLLPNLQKGTAGEVVVNNFDVADEVSAWSWESWSAPTEVGFDETQDAGGSVTGSGSMKVVNSFTGGAGDYSQAVVSVATGSDLDAETLYSKISLDVKVDPSSAPRANSSDYGNLELIFRNGPDWTWNSLGSFALTNTAGWSHLEFPVTAPGDKVHHLTLKLGQNGLTNTITYYVDNIRWTEGEVQIPPPTMAIEKATPGLNLIAGTSGQWDRQNVKSVPTGMGWVDSAEPVSYSFTIKDFPGTNYAGFQTHMYLVPGTPGTGNSPDWNEASAIIVAVQRTAEGGGTAAFRYKTDAPGSNGGYFNTDPSQGQVGYLGSVNGSGVLGTWTVTFTQNNQIAVSAPDGTTTNLVMPAADAQKFAGDITFYCGVMPNETKNIGQSAILSAAKVTQGNTVLLDDSFKTNGLNTEIWTVNAGSASCVSVVGEKDPFWVSWTTPSSGFTLQTNATTSATGWGSPDPAVPDALLGTRKRALITESIVPGANMGFFRLIKQP